MPVVETPSLPGVETVRETTRSYIAYGALGGFIILLGIVIVNGWIIRQYPVDDVLKVLSTISGVLSGVVGAVIGFYFRSEDK